MVTQKLVDEAIERLLPKLAYGVRSDVLKAFEDAYTKTTNAREKRVLSQIIENAYYARDNKLPGCQDTGTVWFNLDVGMQEGIAPDALQNVNALIAKAYENGKLRKSTVQDALFNRSNRRDNTPAFTNVTFKPGKSASLSLLLKGGGSDNASKLYMLEPGRGKKGVIESVLQTVEEKAPNACPPLIVGVGVGSTFDSVGHLAKKALLRPIGSPAQSQEHEKFEQELLDKINSLGIGAAGFGGNYTALAVHVITAPSHIASLPVAVNMGCSAMRSATLFIEDGVIVSQYD